MAGLGERREASLTVIVNGEAREIAGGVSIAGLVELLGLRPDRLAVEVNRRIIRRAEWESTMLGDGDRVELVHFVGGGQGDETNSIWLAGSRR